MERISLTAAMAKSSDFRRRLKDEYGVDAANCYQCGKCSAGCPAAFAMEKTTRQVVRMAQMGLHEQAMGVNSIWLCAQCETCSTRCPRSVEPAKLMEALRIEAKKRGVAPAESNTDRFHELFLESVEKNGRLHEFGLMFKYNLSTGQFFKDADLGPKLMASGKLSLGAHSINDGGAVKRIFENVRKRRGK